MKLLTRLLLLSAFSAVSAQAQINGPQLQITASHDVRSDRVKVYIVSHGRYESLGKSATGYSLSELKSQIETDYERIKTCARIAGYSSVGLTIARYAVAIKYGGKETLQMYRAWKELKALKRLPENDLEAIAEVNARLRKHVKNELYITLLNGMAWLGIFELFHLSREDNTAAKILDLTLNALKTGKPVEMKDVEVVQVKDVLVATFAEMDH